MNPDIKPKARLNAPHEIQSLTMGHSKPGCTSSSDNEICLGRLAGMQTSGLDTGLQQLLLQRKPQ